MSADIIQTGLNVKKILYFEDYYISNYGKVFSYKKNKLKQLKPYYDKDGYLIVNLMQNNNRKAFKVHRLVAIYFINNINNLPQVNHIDGNKENNKYQNLEWCNSSQNNKHAYDSGLKPIKYGENTTNSKLTERQVIEIKNIKNNFTNRKIAKIYKVNEKTIGDIFRGRTWKHIEVNNEI